MIRGWAKSLLFKVAIGAVVLFALLSCVQSASAADIEVSFSFDKPRGSGDYSTYKYFTITNSGNDTLNIDSVSGEIIRITPYPSIIPPGESEIRFTIWASSYADEKTYTEDVHIKKEGVIDSTVTVAITITHCAKIEVSPSSIDFGRVGRKESPSRTIEISEVLGYKSAEVVSVLPRISGNNWVEPDKYYIGSVSPSSSISVTFQMKSEKHPDHNEYSWKYKITSNNAGSATIDIEAYILMPPKLGKLYDEELEIKFDKPKGTVSKYDRYIDVRVRNEGDETMYFNSRFTEYPSGITIKIDNPSGSVSGKSSENIRLHIVAPYNAPEGTYNGKLFVDAGDAGQGYVDITISIIWPVDFTISPSSIDFGSIELKEREYEKKSVNLTLTEFYLYKPVRNLRLSKSGEYGNWLKEERAFAEIPPGESRNITLRIEPGLEAVPKDYSWKYAISASEISAKRMEVKANIIPLNITKMIEGFKSFRGTPLYSNYPSSEVIISNGVEMLEAVERSEIGAEDWKKIPILMKGTLSLLSSLNDGIISSEAKNYGKAVESLWTASVSTSTIESNSELNNWDISGYAKDISAGADKTTEEVLMDEAKMLENRGWDIKKAVEHAMALDDISGLKEEENVLNSSLSYQYAATIYGPGLLNDKEKRLECTYEESRMMDKHDELVSDATDLRIKAENNISNSKENDLIRIRIGDTHLLLNPYKYDTFSARYGSAESDLEDASTKYKVAGELLMSGNTKEAVIKLKSERSYILSLFFLACILYAAAFIYAINRVIMGTVAYMRDMYEREVGDIVIT
ncbi:MAG: hypothetical protein WBD09_08950 [Halobacteriota archaeon]